MKDLAELKDLLNDQLPYLEEEYGVRVIGIFGSYVRNEHGPDSDLDLLIELDRPPKISLIGLVEMEQYLSEMLGVRVDIAIRKNLKKRAGERIQGWICLDCETGGSATANGLHRDQQPVSRQRMADSQKAATAAGLQRTAWRTLRGVR